MRELGFESVMINSNPETVSTDYDTSDLLFFEPLTHEDSEYLRAAQWRAVPASEVGGSAADRGGTLVSKGRDRPVRRANAAEPRPRA